LYGGETISLEEIQVTLNSKKLKEKFDVKVFGVGDGLETRGRSSPSEIRG